MIMDSRLQARKYKINKRRNELCKKCGSVENSHPNVIRNGGNIRICREFKSCGKLTKMDKHILTLGESWKNQKKEWEHLRNEQLKIRKEWVT